VAKGDTKAQVLSSFLKQFYAGTPFIPSEIMLQSEIEDADIIETGCQEGESRRYTFGSRRREPRKSW